MSINTYSTNVILCEHHRDTRTCIGSTDNDHLIGSRLLCCWCLFGSLWVRRVRTNQDSDGVVHCGLTPQEKPRGIGARAFHRANRGRGAAYIPVSEKVAEPDNGLGLRPLVRWSKAMRPDVYYTLTYLGTQYTRWLFPTA